MKYADLHIHTCFSDGALTPEGIVEEARRVGLSCIAITDHDTVGAIALAEERAQEFDLEIIPGVELSTEIDDSEVHILGYFIDWQAEWFRKKLEQICAVRKNRTLAILEKLKALGINLLPDELFAQALPQATGRLHIARLLFKKGFVGSIPEAFDKYLGNRSCCYVKKFKLTPEEAISMISKLNGIAVLAHPYHIGNDELIPEFLHAGLRGLEVYYPEQNSIVTEHYRKLAKKYGLLITGGSDYHGYDKERALLGEIKLSYHLVEALKQEKEALQSGHKGKN